MGGRAWIGRLGALALAGAVAAGALWIGGARAGAAGPGPTAWGLAQLRVPEAWTVSQGAGVTVGVVDSGVDPTAPGLTGRIVATADCIGSGGNETGCRPGPAPDLAGHGTLVTSIAAAVAPSATIVVARAVGASRAGYDEDLAAGIDWVVDHGARVVNVSLSDVDAGGTFLSATLAAAVERAWARGAVPVLAAGNLAEMSPYGDLDALVAAATTATGSLAPYSNTTASAKWGVAAPGSVLALLPGGANAIHSGTSIAAPHVAGAVALLLAHGDNRDLAVQHLLSAAVPCSGCGHGRVDIARALGVVPPAVAPPPPRPAPAAPPPDLEIPDASLLDRAPSLDALQG